ncbi:hypothetical protein [Candidatus Ichthyocystis hellenicum]|uniref:hypothetical protein n=1 Tax=Candidatus Ichthyocystis hellenicum TaxID=1561003 RepID=UPI001111F12E|nr:hypothetical protein [Candidatus Ichthyocystis hellenicum]
MIREHTPTTASNNCVAADCISLEEIISCEGAEMTPETRVLTSSPSSILACDETDRNQEGGYVTVNCRVPEAVYASEEENVLSEIVALSSSSPRVVANNKRDIIAKHRAAAALATIESEYRKEKNNIVLTTLGCHNFFLLWEIICVSLTVIISRPICTKVGESMGELNKNSCEKMVLCLSFSILLIFAVVHIILCCAEKINTRRLEKNYRVNLRSISS